MGTRSLVRVRLVPRDVSITIQLFQSTVNELPDYPAGMVIGSPGVVVVHVVMKESLPACVSEKTDIVKAGSKIGIMYNETFLAVSSKKLFFGYRAVCHKTVRLVAYQAIQTGGRLPLE